MRRAFQDKTGRRVMPPTLWPALQTLVAGLVCFAGIHASGMYPIEVLGSSSFRQGKALWYLYGYLQLSCTLKRFQYYFVWLIAEGACVAMGLGYNGRDANGNAKWCAPPPCVPAVPVSPSQKKAHPHTHTHTHTLTLWSK